MKIPYIKLYTADLLAYTEFLTSQQLGDMLKGICQLGFANQTTYQPKTEMEREVFNTLLSWKEEAQDSLNKRKKAGKKNSALRWRKTPVSDGSNGMHTETDTDTETNTKTETETETKILTAQLPTTAQAAHTQILSAQAKTATAQKESAALPDEPTTHPADKKQSSNALEKFGDQVILHFEKDLSTDEQKRIWFKRNARNLSDIFNFCGKDVALALATIKACQDRLEEAHLKGGYEAVCRNLPLYYQTAQDRLRAGENPYNANTPPEAARPQQERVLQAQRGAYAALVAHMKKHGAKVFPTLEEFVNRE